MSPKIKLEFDRGEGVVKVPLRFKGEPGREIGPSLADREWSPYERFDIPSETALANHLRRQVCNRCGHVGKCGERPGRIDEEGRVFTLWGNRPMDLQKLPNGCAFKRGVEAKLPQGVSVRSPEDF